MYPRELAKISTNIKYLQWALVENPNLYLHLIHKIGLHRDWMNGGERLRN